jgi:hypothetical protein
VIGAEKKGDSGREVVVEKFQWMDTVKETTNVLQSIFLA